jgi:hypothetical protein
MYSMITTTKYSNTLNTNTCTFWPYQKASQGGLIRGDLSGGTNLACVCGGTITITVTVIDIQHITECSYRPFKRNTLERHIRIDDILFLSFILPFSFFRSLSFRRRPIARMPVYTQRRCQPSQSLFFRGEQKRREKKRRRCTRRRERDVFSGTEQSLSFSNLPLFLPLYQRLYLPLYLHLYWISCI